MNRAQLVDQIKAKQSFLCVGLDTDISKIPKHLLKTENPILEFNKQIIDATKDYCVSYKLNIAFYECLGAKGWEILEETLKYIPKDIFTISDAKRGDIGNTSKMYAKAFFENMDFDSVTVAPYMGEDSVSPFWEYDNKWVILLALTSNKGGDDFQRVEDANGPLYRQVIEKSAAWGRTDNLMYVVGATRPEMFKEIRAVAPDHFLLVPGVGAQGGTLAEVCKYGLNNDIGLLINSSRGIIYAGSDEDFAKKAGEEAKKLQLDMETYVAQLS
jgi:orotidine-5'-phosphate decarboxylase